MQLLQKHGALLDALGCKIKYIYIYTHVPLAISLVPPSPGLSMMKQPQTLFPPPACVHAWISPLGIDISEFTWQSFAELYTEAELGLHWWSDNGVAMRCMVVQRLPW